MAINNVIQVLASAMQERELNTSSKEIRNGDER
jgi:hypothetical protein